MKLAPQFYPAYGMFQVRICVLRKQLSDVERNHFKRCKLVVFTDFWLTCQDFAPGDQ
ncbi:hypothetical protein C0J52_04300 [Blattella germanica]|nr:hypothetical protein C0J52_04300 [Blattella germanica]